MGIVVNRKSRRLTLPDLLVQLDIIKQDEAIRLPGKITGSVPVLRGGPVEMQRGFVLHSTDYGADDSTLTINPGISLTATVDILRAIAKGTGPSRALLALGYAGWSAGQLENEILANGWLSVPADAELLFDPDLEGKYERTMRKLGVDPAMLSREAGRA
jgi:putative transcriptional regulator